MNHEECQMKFNRVFSALTLYQHNMKVLHWTSCGVNFDSTHAITEDYAEKFGSMQDEIAEIMSSLDYRPLCLCSALEILENDTNCQYISVDATKNYNKKSAFKLIGSMFESLICLYRELRECECCVTSEIGSKLDEHLGFFRVEHLYKNKQRSIED